MALKATINKADLSVADMDRGYYAQHSLTLAQHPSETDERLMLRLLAFALHASDSIEFGRGISDDEEPALWQKTLTDDIEVWIELGQPDEKRIRRACQRAREVWVYTYGNRTADTWWKPLEGAVSRFDNLHVCVLDNDTMNALGALLGRTMQIQVSIQDHQILVSTDQTSLTLELVKLK